METEGLQPTTDDVLLPSPCMVILVGPAGVGKSTWAAAHFSADQVVSSDALRGVVGEGPYDQAASADAFALIDEIVTRRLRRRLTAVIDSLGIDRATRARWRDMAARAGVPCFAAVFEVVDGDVRSANEARPNPVPDAVVRSQLQRWPDVVGEVESEPYARIIRVRPGTRAAVSALAPDTARPPTTNAATAVTTTVPAASVAVGTGTGQAPGARPLRFGLQIPRFEFPGGPAELGPRLREIATHAEDVGFDHLWVMDHFRQIPQAGRAWDNMPESWTTLAHLAAVTSTIRLGTMVTGVTYRNTAHLAKIVATLDVLSGGRVICGLGAAWFRQEHEAYGWPFPTVARRLDMLEDALQLLPLMWGPGSPAFDGRTITVPEALCYPRPVQDRVPILVGGSGERRTLRLVARYADACNLFGDPDDVRRKLAVLSRHCADVGRDPAAIEVTHLSTALVGDDRAHVDRLVEALRPPRTGAERFARSVNAGSVDEHVGKAMALVGAGVHTIIVSLADIGPASITRFADVIAGARALTTL